MKRVRLKRRQILMLCALLLVLRADINADDATKTRNSLNNLLAKLARDHVGWYSDRSYCRLLTTSAAAYMDAIPEGNSDSCAPPDAQPIRFDQNAEKLFNRVHQAVNASGLDLTTFVVRYDAKGAISSAEFDVDQSLGHSWYMYDSKRPVSEFHKAIVTQLGGGWAYIETD